MNRTRLVLLIGMLGTLAGDSPLMAQPIAVLRWQLQPYCNIVTLAVTQNGGVYTLDGADDQCGAGQLASIVGTAFLNPDGSIGLGLTTVIAPGGAPVHIDARISLASLNGPWRDSAGNSGSFVFTPGPSIGGPLRPVAPNGVAPGSITAAQLAPGLVGSGQINPSQVQARVSGTCSVGQYLRGINPDGTVVCEPLLTPNVSTTVDDITNGVGFFTSIAIGTDGLPVISHQDATADTLRVTHCGNPACTADNTRITVDDPANSVGQFTSIAIGADGLPVISHRDSTAAALRVTHCGNVACTAGNASITVDDPANSVGWYSSLAIGANGLPIISHWDQTAGGLRVTRCGNAACNAGNDSATIDNPANDVGQYSSIAIGVDGLPVISHRDNTAGALRVTHCGNAACTAGNVSNNIDSGGSYTSIAIGIDGRPIISHRDNSDDLWVTRCGNAACTNGNVSTTVSTGQLEDTATSIAIGTDGLPIISYRNVGSSSILRVVHCGDAGCTGGNIISSADPSSIGAGLYSSIAIGADGLPVISHHDPSAASALRVTKCATKTCQ